MGTAAFHHKVPGGQISLPKWKCGNGWCMGDFITGAASGTPTPGTPAPALPKPPLPPVYKTVPTWTDTITEEVVDPRTNIVYEVEVPVPT